MVSATTITELKDKITATQNELNKFDDQISDIEDEQDLLHEQMDDLTSEIVNLLASIGLLEEDIANKEADIAYTQASYEAALQKEQDQAEAIAIQMQFMYERGNSSIISMLLESASFKDLLNKVEYANQVYEYDMEMLHEFEHTRTQVHELWDQLVAEKDTLEQNNKELHNQKDYCDGLMAQLQIQVDNYEIALAQVKSSAAAAQAKIKKDQQELKKLEEEERKNQLAAAAAAAANATYPTTDYTTTINNASGSDLGKQIARYACQFIGNPYVSGGTSLTNGADCSGFTFRVYKDFGYTLPRTSYEQRSAGKSVEYANAEPGDLICYSGHVGLYIGGGLIVHASSAKTGIKVSKATYREILAVRRII